MASSPSSDIRFVQFMASSPSSDMLSPIVIVQDICKQKCVHIVTANEMEEFEDTKGR
jgi:hypothetical protein